MAKLTPEEFQEKWAKRLKAASSEMKDGANRLTTAPSQSAIKAQEKMLVNLIESIENGTWAKELGKVSLEDWRKHFIDKGIPRMSKGIDGADEKMKEFATWLNARIDAGLPMIDKMPDLTLDDSIARASAWIRHMGEKKYKGR